MLIFDDMYGENSAWFFVHDGFGVLVNPIPATCMVSVANGVIFEGTCDECNAEFDRLGLVPKED